MRTIAQFTHNKAVWLSFVSHFLRDPHLHHHHQQLPFLQASNRNANYTPSWETAPCADIIQRSVCIVRWIDTREVTGIYNIKWWNPLQWLCNGYDRVRKVWNKSSCLQSFAEETPVRSLPLSLSPLILCQRINVWNDSVSVIGPIPKATLWKTQHALCP